MNLNSYITMKGLLENMRNSVGTIDSKGESFYRGMLRLELFREEIVLGAMCGITKLNEKNSNKFGV